MPGRQASGNAHHLTEQDGILNKSRSRSLENECRTGGLAWSPGALYGILPIAPSRVTSWHSRETECKAPSWWLSIGLQKGRQAERQGILSQLFDSSRDIWERRAKM